MSNKKIIHLRYKLNPSTQMLYCGSTVIHQDSKRATTSPSHATCINCGNSYETEQVAKYNASLKIHYMPISTPPGTTWCACGDYIFHFKRTRNKNKVTCSNCINSTWFKKSK